MAFVRVDAVDLQVTGGPSMSLKAHVQSRLYDAMCRAGSMMPQPKTPLLQAGENAGRHLGRLVELSVL